MFFKKVLSVLIASTMLLSLVGCNGNEQSSSDMSSEQPSSSATGEVTASKNVYYLNFKPEVATVYDEIAKVYKDETGVTLKVVTAASGTYEQTLKSEMAKSEPPTLFQINGPIGYASWKDYCKDLTDSQIYNHLLSDDYAVKVDDKVYGIASVVESYGIIYNNEIMNRYFESENKKTDVLSVEEIDNFETFKSVVEDMQLMKDELGIKGVFASTSLQSGEDWRWHTHLANIPMYFEWKDNNISLGDSDAISEIDFNYNENFKNIFDLYINNSVVEPTLLGTKQVADSMAEFALGQCAMVQNGNWAWSQVNDVAGNVVAEDDIKMMPIYTGIDGEENYGLATGTENFFAVNSKVSPEDQKAAEDFMLWLFTSDSGKDFVINKLNFIAPYDSFNESEQPTDPLSKEVIRYMNNDNLTTVSWVTTVFPSQTFKDNFGSQLLSYAQGKSTWDSVKQSIVDDWKTEYQK